MGKSSWGDLIEQLHQKNLFILPVENEGTWLRYHHLFQDFLQGHFQRHFPDQARDLNKKLVGIYQAQNRLNKAYDICKKLDDQQLLVDYIKVSVRTCSTPDSYQP